MVWYRYKLHYFYICLILFQLITVYKVPGLDPDWLMAERGSQKGKVPNTYLEVLEWITHNYILSIFVINCKFMKSYRKRWITTQCVNRRFKDRRSERRYLYTVNKLSMWYKLFQEKLSIFTLKLYYVMYQSF